MSRSSTLAKPTAREPAVQADATNPVSMLQYALDRGIEPAKLKEMMDLVNQWKEREAAEHFGHQFARFQADCPAITKEKLVKNKDGSHRYKFASMDDVDEVVRPVLARHGLSVSGTINTAGDCINVTWTIQCGSHKEPRVFALPKVAAAGIIQGGNGLQDLGAWMSYIRRYTYTMALNVIVAGEDSDANTMQNLLLIDDQQRKELNDLIAQEQMDEKRINKLLRWIGAESLDTITRSQFQKIVSTYRQKKADQAQHQGAA